MANVPPGGLTGPPDSMRTNELPYWIDTAITDKFFTEYDSGAFTLTYIFAGPQSGAPVQLIAQPNPNGFPGQGWRTQFDATNSAKMLAGLYGWQGVLTDIPAQFTGTIAGTTLTVNSAITGGPILAGAALTGAGITAGTAVVNGNANVWTVNQSQSVGPVAMTATLDARLVAGEGQIIVEPDYSQLTTGFDPRTQAQIALDNAEQALSVFQSSGGRVKSYSIAGRQMTFQDDKEIKVLVDYFRGRVEAERQEASGGDRRNLRIGFSPPTTGSPASPSRNWPWWR